jgi:hypothetical protein
VHLESLTLVHLAALVSTTLSGPFRNLRQFLQHFLQQFTTKDLKTLSTALLSRQPPVSRVRRVRQHQQSLYDGPLGYLAAAESLQLSFNLSSIP